MNNHTISQAYNLVYSLYHNLWFKGPFTIAWKSGWVDLACITIIPRHVWASGILWKLSANHVLLCSHTWGQAGSSGLWSLWLVALSTWVFWVILPSFSESRGSWEFYTSKTTYFNERSKMISLFPIRVLMVPTKTLTFKQKIQLQIGIESVFWYCHYFMYNYCYF